MHRKAVFACALTAWLVAPTPTVFALGGPPRTFETDIRPVLERYCLQHQSRRPSPRRASTSPGFNNGNSLRKSPDLWQKVSDAVDERTMPPAGSKSPEPSDAEREQMVRAIEEILDASADGKDPGNAPIQRLTRQQYNNTIRDLLGVDTHPADAFPADGGGGGGFDNNASTLFVPPILMEKYLAAAAGVLDKADPKFWRSVPPDPANPHEAGARPAWKRSLVGHFDAPSIATKSIVFSPCIAEPKAGANRSVTR